MDKCCCYRRDNNTYFQKWHITKTIYIACGLMAATQLFITISYLGFHVWFWFITLGFIIAANVCFIYALRSQNAQLIKIMIVYQVRRERHTKTEFPNFEALFALVYMGSTINTIINIIHPMGWSYTSCTVHNGNVKCTSHIRVRSIIYFPLYFMFTIVNIWCFFVLWNYYKYMTGENNRQPGYTRRPMPRTEPPRQTTVPPPPVPSQPKPNNSQPTPTTGTGVMTPNSVPPPTTYSPYSGAGSVYTTDASQAYNNPAVPTFGEYSSQQRGYKNPQSPPQLAAPDPSPFNPNWDSAPSSNPANNQNLNKW